MAEKVLAAVRTAPSTTEIREFAMPDIPEDSALMKMEVAGICGTDVKLYKTPPTKDPVIMGHENIGYIAKAGREFTRRKGFKVGDLVFVAGQLALKPGHTEMAGDTIGEQTEQVMANLRAILEAAGSGLDRLVKTTVFLANLDDFQGMNEVYARHVGERPPARSTVEVSRLPSGALVEIEAIAHL